MWLKLKFWVKPNPIEILSAESPMFEGLATIKDPKEIQNAVNRLIQNAK